MTCQTHATDVPGLSFCSCKPCLVCCMSSMLTISTCMAALFPSMQVCSQPGSFFCNSVPNNVSFNADVVSGRSNGYDDTNSLGRKLLQSGEECSAIVLLDKHPRLIMTVHELSCIVLTEILNLASPQQCQLHHCTAWCCLFAQAGLHTHCYCRRASSVFAFTYLAAYMSSNALQRSMLIVESESH